MTLKPKLNLSKSSIRSSKIFNTRLQTLLSYQIGVKDLLWSTRGDTWYIVLRRNIWEPADLHNVLCLLLISRRNSWDLELFISYRHVAALKNRLFGLVFFIDACIQSAKTMCVIKQSSLTAVSTSVKRLPRQSRGSDSRCVLNSSHRLLLGFLRGRRSAWPLMLYLLRRPLLLRLHQWVINSSPFQPNRLVLVSSRGGR